jgi:hypothetical protein
MKINKSKVTAHKQTDTRMNTHTHSISPKLSHKLLRFAFSFPSIWSEISENKKRNLSENQYKWHAFELVLFRFFFRLVLLPQMLMLFKNTKEESEH